MSNSSRWPGRYRTWLGAIALVALAAAPTRAGQTIFIDPDRGGPAATRAVDTFDPQPGNALITPATGTSVTEPFVGQIFTVLYQATINIIQNAGATAVTYTGLPVGTTPNVLSLVDGELTIVARFNEVVTVVTGAPGVGVISLSLATPQVGSFIELWYDGASPDANNLLGTGFRDGMMVYQGSVNATGSGGFTATGIGADPDLDNFLVDNYPGINSVGGSGGTTLSTTTTSFDPTFFITSLIGAGFTFQFDFNSSIVLPYGQVDPASVLFDGTIAAGTPGAAIANGTIGSVNGASVANGGGPNQLLQADANGSFTNAAVPEPGTISMALTGIGLTSLAALRRRRRPAGPSAA